MTKKMTKRLICLLLVTAILFGAVTVFAYHGEFWFPLLERLRIHEDLPWQRAEDFSGVEYSISYLNQSKIATASNVWMLVNASHPLPEGYTASLVEYGGAKMHPLMVQPYVAMRDDVKAATGVRIYVVSDYRTSEEQHEIIQSSEAGVAAQIGCSEHEAGLALDVYAPHYDGKQFLRSDAGRMINRICGEYGFIVRYPVGKEDVTGISYEPWHLRYVGAPHAKIIMDSGVAYEEYVEFFSPNTWYTYGGYYVGRFSEGSVKLPQNWINCEISPDNTGYYMITVTV